MANFYTYAHFATGRVLPFYIGKGKGYRAYEVNGRSTEWKIAAANGYSVKILATWDSEDDAFSHERLMISVFKSLSANLANKNAGGSGQSNPSPETRRKISKTLSLSLKPLKEEMSKRMKEKWRTPGYREKMIAARQPYCDSIKKPRLTAEQKFEIKSKASKQKMTLEARQKHSEAIKAKWADPEFRRRMLEARKKQ